MKTIAVDVDGVVASFNPAFMALHPEVPWPVDRTDWPNEWHWPKQYLTNKQISQTWEWIVKQDDFWLGLQPEAGAKDFLRHLDRLMWHKVYYVTRRVGDSCKRQTEMWLSDQGVQYPTVIVSEANKGQLCQELGVEAILDDKPKNLFGPGYHPGIRRYLLDRTYNQDLNQYGVPEEEARFIHRIYSLQEFLDREDLTNGGREVRCEQQRALTIG